MSKVDVLIPTFNAAHVLPGALESLIAQTEPDWHVVVVDDGSTDNTSVIVKPYLDRLGSRITFLQQKNGGPSAARNAGIRATHSPLIAFLDADDLWPADRLQHTLPVFEKELDVGLSYGRITRFREPGGTVDTFWGNPGRAEGRVAREIYTRAIELPCCSVTVRRACLDVVGLFDESLQATEDRDLWLRVAQQFKVRFIPEILAQYRMSDGSQSADPARLLATQRRFIEKHYGAPCCGWKERRAALARIYKQQADHHAGRKQFGRSMQNAAHAAALAPWELTNLRTAVSIGLRATGLVGGRQSSRFGA